MKREIENIEDIKLLIDRFYEKVIRDSLIGPVFTVTIKVNWERHLPIMYSFWENTLFYTGTYTGNPMQIHQRIHQLANLSAAHFDQWTKIFCSTVNEYFYGEKARLAKERAVSIAEIMKIKILDTKISG